jgi:putative FmdB family regulatory protein
MDSGLTGVENFSILVYFLLMPTYEYECQKCGHRFEVFQSIKDKPKRTCPKCCGRVKRLLGTGVGLLFKGSGFYTTDYRKPSYREAASKESGTGTTTSSSKDSTAAVASTAGKKRSKD